MRIILEIISGPETGKRVALRTGQLLRVGRTEWADWAVPGDARLSSMHFAVSTSEEGCFLEDLGSSNGTCLNEQPVAGKVAISPGDLIRAGQTVFRIHGSEITSTAVSKSPVLVPPERPTVPSTKEAVRFSLETCDSGITLCQGHTEDIAPSALSGQLARFAPVCSIFDFQKAGTTPPDDIHQPRYLFDWLTPEAAAAVSPTLLAPNDTIQWPSLVDELWGADAVVTLFSKLADDELLAHLHTCIRPQGSHAPQQAGMLGLCWPSVTAILLAHHSGDIVKRFLAGVEVVLVELPDLPETWQLFGGEPLPGWLTSLGFDRAPPETGEADDCDATSPTQ